MQGRAFHARHKFNESGIAHILNEPVDDVVAEFAMRHLAAAEAQASLDLVAIDQEPDCLILLGLVVVLVNGNGEFDFLDDDDLLLLAGRSFALFLLVKIASIILDAADRRNRIGRDLNQVQSPLACNLQCLEGRQDAELFAVFIDDADFAGANPVVNADKRFCRTFVECDGTPPDVVPAALGRAQIDSATATHPEYSIGPLGRA